MLVLLVIVLLLLLLSGGPRFGWYGTRSTTYDVFGIILLIVLVYVVLALLSLAPAILMVTPVYAQGTPVNVAPSSVAVPINVPNVVLWSTVVGFVLPPVLSIVQQPSWTDQARAWVAFIACIPFAAGTVYFNGAFNAADLVTSFLLIFVTAISTYKMFWKPTQISVKIEKATSRVPQGATTAHELHT
jgi:hypothetical protein